MKLGIPRALPGLLMGNRIAAFLEALGHQVVWSEPSDPATLAMGDGRAPHDLCLPVKLHLGHVLRLADRVDRILVPRLLSLDRSRWLCPHFLGLPDTVRAMVGKPLPLLTPVWDLRRDGSLEPGFLRLARELGHSDRDARAALAAVPERSAPSTEPPGRGRIAVLGHPYILDDPVLSAEIPRWLRGKGYRVVRTEEVPPAEQDRCCGELARDVFWYSARQIVGSAFSLLEGGADGVILISSFGCGPDSLIRELVEIRSRRQGRVPLLALVVDEHGSAVGLETRLEAFLDMVSARRSGGAE